MFSPITTEPPTEKQMAEIRARREAITDAPWGSRGDLDGSQTVQAGAWVTPEEGFSSSGDVANVLGDTDEQRYRRANFISQAPYDIDRLLAEVDRLRKLNAFLIKQIQKKDARTGEADAKVRAFLNGDAESPVAPRTERSYWVAICDALNAAVAAGLPIGIDLDGTITDRNAWSVVWNPERKRWAVAGYDDEGGAR